MTLAKSRSFIAAVNGVLKSFPNILAGFEAPSLAKIIDTVTQVLPAGRLIFVVDQSTIEGHIDAEVQFLEVSEKSGALIVGSGVWPMI